MRSRYNCYTRFVGSIGNYCITLRIIPIYSCGNCAMYWLSVAKYLSSSTWPIFVRARVGVVRQLVLPQRFCKVGLAGYAGAFFRRCYL